MQTLDVIKLAASTLAKTGVALWQALRPITDDETDNEPFGEIDVFQGLGLTSFPYPADKDGHAEGVIVTNCGNKNAVCVGARDTRTAKIVGNGKPGDTILHSTGPSQSAQVQLKEAKRQVVLATKNSNDETQALLIDGKNEKFQIAVGGCMFEIADGGFTLTDASGRGTLIVRNGTINLVGKVVAGGLTPVPALSVMLGPVTGQVPPTPVPLVAAKGFFIGV